jgi:hypothetical protein
MRTSSKLDPRLRALLSLDRSALVARKQADDDRRRRQLDAIAGLREELRHAAGDEARRETLRREITRHIATFPIPLTFGLYLPENAPRWSGVTLTGPAVSATVRSQASADDLRSLGLHVRSEAGDVFTVFLPLELSQRLAESRAIDYVELARPYAAQLMDAIPMVRLAQLHNLGITGAGVIVGIIDSGLDFYHEHFRRDDGTTRVLYLWDQILAPLAGETGPPANLLSSSPLGTTYGVEYQAAQIQAELNSAAATRYGIVRSTPGQHGTLTASCAAGGGHYDITVGRLRIFQGAAPEADIIHVRTDNMGNEDIYADSTNILDGFAYIFGRASQLGRACVVNLSSSDNLGAHDGSTNGELFLDALLLEPGRAITCAAGNQNIVGVANGQFFSAHTVGSVAQGQTTDVKLDCDAAAINDDTVQIWYDGQDEFEVTVTVPTTIPTVIGPIPQDTSSPPVLAGGITVTALSESYPNNGDRFIQVHLAGTSAATPLPDGEWTLSITGTNVVNGAFNAWIDRNNFGLLHWQNPILDTGTIGVPATARRVIAVGAHDNSGGPCQLANSAIPAIVPFSGCGPSRDGRIKPDIAAIGLVRAAAAWNRNDAQPQDFPLTALGAFGGTSIAAPIVGGAAALLFQCRGSGLSASDITQLLTASAKPPDAGVPSNAFGFGYLCMEGICAAPVGDVDVWLRDAPTDTGLEPFTGAVTWLSPDIELLDAAGVAVANPTHDPANLWNNLVDVTVRNRGGQTANNVAVYLYWADPATNLPFPSEWKISGIYTGATFVEQGNVIVIPQLPAGGQMTVRFAWAPPAAGSNISGDDHFCLLARVEHDSDPSNLNAGGWPVIAGSNNIALHNLHVVNASSASTMGFMVIGSGDDDALEIVQDGLSGELEVTLPTSGLPWRELALIEHVGKRPEYPAHGSEDGGERLRRVLGADEAARILNVAGVAEAHVDGPLTRLIAREHLKLRSIRVRHGAKMPVRLTIREPKLHGRAGRIHVGQRSGGKRIGGVSLELRDALAPGPSYDVRRRGDKVEVTARTHDRHTRPKV